MRRRAFLVAAACTAVPCATRAGMHPRAVLELFTSQGCSSCPPADALLGQVAHLAGVVALAWHVDYWDRLGWHDPFASRFATARQRAYAQRLGEQVYTPALVVNGARMLVGSDRAHVLSAVSASTTLPTAVSLRREAGGLTAMIGAASGSVTALLAKFDPERATQIGAGENDGRLLREYNIVRSVNQIAAWNGQPRTFHFDAPPASEGAALIVQDAQLRVLGAALLAPQGVTAA